MPFLESHKGFSFHLFLIKISRFQVKPSHEPTNQPTNQPIYLPTSAPASGCAHVQLVFGGLRKETEKKSWPFKTITIISLSLMWSSAKVTAEGTAVSAQWYRPHWQLASRLVAQTHYLQNKSLTFQCTLQYRSNVANALVAQIVRPSSCLFFFICRAIVRVLYICKIPRHIQNIITTKKNMCTCVFNYWKKTLEQDIENLS